MRLLFVFSALLFPVLSQAAIKGRAREHYEVHSISNLDDTEIYRGLSNTFNLWYEVPYKYSLGLAVSPIIGSAQNNDDNNSYGEKVRLYSAGFELKYFPHPLLRNTYLRIGSGYSQLRTETTPRISRGYNLYSGIGYEFRLSRAGIAVEMAYRYSRLNNDIVINTFTPSVGVHFYDAL